MKTINFCKVILVVAASALCLHACNPGNLEYKYPDQLSVIVEDLEFESNGEAQSVEVNTNASSWNASSPDTWIKISHEENQFSVKVDEYTETKGDRTGSITVKAGEATPVTITVTQLMPAFYNDMEVVKLQSATVGKGVNIVIMGDGYTSNDMRRRTGKYEKEMRETADHFFSVNPYSRYRDHFNVYMVVAISNQEGISVKSTGKKVDTKFGTALESETSSGISCNPVKVFNYMKVVSELKNVNDDDITVVIPINADIYAGTCYMYGPENTIGDGSGFTISLCPVSRKSTSRNIVTDFRAIVIHEACGHGFAKLSDEYIYYNTSIPIEEKTKVISHKKNWDWNANVDFYSSITGTSWKGFVNNTKYGAVGAYEGAHFYSKGIWRPEQNSCMNDNVAYFNAPSRWAQVNRIKKLAGFSYTFEQFLQDDVVPEYPKTTGTKNMEEFTPLAPPVVMENLPVRNSIQ